MAKRWLDLQEWLKKATEEEVEAALLDTLKGEARPYMVKRLYGAYAKLRETRERKELKLC